MQVCGKKNGRIDYVANMATPTLKQVQNISGTRQSRSIIEKTCAIDRCESRTGRAQRNDMLLSIAGWVEQYKQRIINKNEMSLKMEHL